MLNKLSKLTVISGLLLGFCSCAWAEASDTIWPSIKESFFPKKTIGDAPFIKITAPRRAESGAQVPFAISIDQTQHEANAIKKVYVIVDANPIQLAATYYLTDMLGKFNLETRIRMETDSFVRVIGETADGKLYMTATSIRAAGGCGGTVDGTDDSAMRAAAGKIKMNVKSPVVLGTATPAVFMIKHPMRTGLQRDLVSQGFMPAFYIQKAAFTYNNKPLFNVDFGVGTSENPYLHFDFIPDAPGKLAVKAVDNEGKSFEHQIDVSN